MSDKRLSTTLPPKKLTSSTPSFLAQSNLGIFSKPKVKPNVLKKVKEEPKASESATTSDANTFKRNGSSSKGVKRPHSNDKPGREGFSKFVEGQSLFAAGIGDTRRPVGEGSLRSSSSGVFVRSSTGHSSFQSSAQDQFGVQNERNSEVLQFLSRLPQCNTEPQQMEQLNKLMPTLTERKESPWLQTKVLQSTADAQRRWRVDDLDNKTFLLTVPHILVRNETQDFLRSARQFTYNDPRQQIELQRIMDKEDHCLNRSTLPSGCLGNVRVYDNGEIEMTLNGVNYHCEERPMDSDLLLIRKENKQMKCLTPVQRHLEVMLDVRGTRHKSAVPSANSLPRVLDKNS